MIVNTLLVAERGDEPHPKDHLRLVTELPPPLPDAATCRVAVIGLGYVGLPLVLGFAKASRAIGFDISRSKVDELKRGLDFTGEVNGNELRMANAEFTTELQALRDAEVVIVCVPTPVNSHNRPDYGPLIAASRTIGQNLKRGAVVVFESTVDPGTTEERCLPVIEQVSGLKEGIDFYLAIRPSGSIRVTPPASWPTSRRSWRAQRRR